MDRCHTIKMEDKLYSMDISQMYKKSNSTLRKQYFTATVYIQKTKGLIEIIFCRYKSNH